MWYTDETKEETVSDFHHLKEEDFVHVGTMVSLTTRLIAASKLENRSEAASKRASDLAVQFMDYASWIMTRKDDTPKLSW